MEGIVDGLFFWGGGVLSWVFTGQTDDSLDAIVSLPAMLIGIAPHHST